VTFLHVAIILQEVQFQHVSTNKIHYYKSYTATHVHTGHNFAIRGVSYSTAHA